MAWNFRYDERRVREQYEATRAAGGDVEREAKAARIWDESHGVFLGADFVDGTIEADVCGAGSNDFQGFVFRASSESARAHVFGGDVIYFRPFYANNRDPHFAALQYFGSKANGRVRTWSGGVEAGASIPKDRWFHVRIEVAGTSARVFLDGSSNPSLTIDRLASEGAGGLVGLWAWKGHIANVGGVLRTMTE